MKDYKLKIDLLPKGAWNNDLSKTLSSKDWDIIREKCYKRANNVCEICGTKTENLNAHEVWEFDIDNKIQTLKKIIAICSKCHGVIHFRNSQRLGFGENAKKHFMKVNNCSELDFASHLAEAIILFEERNKIYRWKMIVDLSEYDNNILIKQPYLPYIINPYKSDDLEQLQNKISLAPNIEMIEIDNYRGLIILKCRNMNKIVWCDQDNKIISTKFFFSKFPIIEFCVKDLKCESIILKLNGPNGEYISNPFVIQSPN